MPADPQTTRRRKPSEIVPGRAYRLARWGKRSDDVVLVTEIKRTTKTARIVCFEPLGPKGFSDYDSYTGFMARVWAEERRAVQ